MEKIVSSPPSPKHSLTESMRGWGDALSLWRLCANATCRRARCCRGNARVCFPRNFRLLPEGVRAWFGGIGEAQEEELTWEEAMAWLDTTPAGEAYHEWNESVRTSLGEAPADGAPPLWRDA